LEVEDSSSAVETPEDFAVFRDLESVQTEKRIFKNNYFKLPRVELSF